MCQGSPPQIVQDSSQTEKPGAWVRGSSNPPLVAAQPGWELPHQPSGQEKGLFRTTTLPGWKQQTSACHKKAFNVMGKILISLRLYKSRGQTHRQHQPFPKPAPCSRSQTWHHDLYNLYTYFEKSKNVKRSLKAVYLHPKHQASWLQGRHRCRLHSHDIICALHSNQKDICSLDKQEKSDFFQVFSAMR